MESLSRPPHRRNRSTNVPYDDVFLSKPGKGKLLRPQDYTEIFSGSSSIPVLDIPAIDDRTGSTGYRISALDYSSIFGGLKSVDAALPYEELVCGSAKRSKPRILENSASFSQPSSSAHSSGNTKMFSGEASKQSGEEAKKQFKKSFSQKNQRNSNSSNGKTHIAHLHSVPGFTHFVDEIPRPPQKLEDHKPVPTLKHDVSRTWSFSGDVDNPKGKPGLRSDQSHLPNLCDNTNEVDPRSHFPKMPSSSSYPLNSSDNKDPRRSRASNFISEKTASECSLPFFDGEFDENSVAAASAAALKKAIEQAQESIRLAKIIMERTRESNEGSSKSRSSGCMEDFDKKTKSDPAAYGSEKNNCRGGYDDSVPKFTSIDRNVPFPNQNDTLTDAGNHKEEREQKKDEATKESAEAIAGGDELFVSSGSGGAGIYIDKISELETHVKIVEAADKHAEGTDVPGLVASAENRTLNSKSAEVVEVDKKTGEQGDAAEVLTEMVDADKKTGEQGDAAEVPTAMVEKDASVTEDEHKDGPEIIFTLGEGVLHATQRAQEKEKIMVEVDENSKIRIEERVIMEENDINDQGKCEIKSEECKLLNAEYLTAVEPPLEKFLDESCNLVRNEVQEQEETHRNSESVYNWEENGQGDGVHGEEENGARQEEAQLSSESKEQPKEALLVEINEMEANVLSEIGMFEKNGDAHEPEIDYKKQNNTRDEDEQNFPGEENHKSASECESAASIEMDAHNSTEVQKKDAISDTQEANSTHRGTEQSEEDNDIKSQEPAYKEDVDEAVDADDIIFRESQKIGEVELSCIAEEYKKAVNGHKEDDLTSEVAGTSSLIDGDTKAEQLFPLEDMDNLRQLAPEYTSSDDNAENAGVSDTVPKERSATDSEIHVLAQDHATEINSEQLPDVLSSDNEKVEFDLTGVRLVSEQTSESDEGSVSTSSYENIDGFSSQESDGCAENAKDETSDKEELVGELQVSSESDCAKKQSEQVCSEFHGNPEETDKFMETGRTVEKNTENHMDDPVGTSGAGEKDAQECDDNLGREEHQQKTDAIQKREQEKDRIVVERAIREARARAFAEVRERAERAAVERAAAEVRQRVMAEAQEKLEKASMVKPPANKASIAAKLRAERAAVERATAEARERALKKAMSQKNLAESRTKYQTESSAGNNKLKHSFSSPDLETASSHESPQRRKARLERHQRIMERAEKALAEKYKRDILAQKEQAERNRLAESLDADIKRWAFGKEGNLRALLSTLQYILGPDSNWQPISLTEVVTAAAVKKAYRKATLYVHPDKLQQRGATIQQKYICEKVFDLLKAAWNKFSSDER